MSVVVIRGKAEGELRIRCTRCQLVWVTWGEADIAKSVLEALHHHDADWLRPDAVKVEMMPDPCAGGACPDPEMHAEGGHDV